MKTRRHETTREALLAECALFDLQRASRVMSGLYNSHLRSAGTTIAQFSLLRNIKALQPVSIMRLADALLMDRTSVTRLIEPLVRRHLVTIEAGEDRRIKNLRLTDKGRVGLSRSEKPWRDAQGSLLSTIGTENWLAMRRVLRTAVRLVRDRRDGGEPVLPTRAR